ncbi:MAG: PEGA domain-containing protein [Candidatus Sulfotelmatobacter sp.]
MDGSILRCLALTLGTALTVGQVRALSADVKLTAQAAVAGQTAAQSPSPTPAARFAHLRVYRPRRVTGSALAPSIYVDDREVARVGNGRRISIRLSPGTHNVRSDDKSSAIALDAEAGQEYFVRVDEAVGFWKGHGKLTLLLPEQGSAEFQMQRPVEDDRRIARDLIEDDAIVEGSPDSVPPASATDASNESRTVKVWFTSNPPGADIEIDGNFVGNTPSSVELATGDHSVTIKKSGYGAWARKLKVMGGDIKLNADLEKAKEPQ